MNGVRRNRKSRIVGDKKSKNADKAVKSHSTRSYRIIKVATNIFPFNSVLLRSKSTTDMSDCLRHD